MLKLCFSPYAFINLHNSGTMSRSRKFTHEHGKPHAVSSLYNRGIYSNSYYCACYVYSCYVDQARPQDAFNICLVYVYIDPVYVASWWIG